MTSRGHTQGTDEFSEVNFAISIDVESAKNVLRELAGVSIGKEVCVYLLELIHRELPTRTVLEEAAIPLSDLLVCKLRLGSEAGQFVWL